MAAEPTMTVNVRCYGPARRLAGVELVELTVLADATVSEAVATLAAHTPDLAELLGHCAFAVGDELVSGSHRLTPGTELGLLPPVAGGCRR